MNDQISQAEEFAKYGAPKTTVRDCDFIGRTLRDSRSQNPRLLDIACGTGRHSIELANRGYTVCGFDISETAIAYARDQIPQKQTGTCEFLVADFQDISFDAEYNCAFMMYHTLALVVTNAEVIRLFSNVHDALRGGGIFIIHLYSEWKFISEGTLRNDSGTRRHEDGDTVRIEEMNIRISNVNNVRSHSATSRFLRDGIERPGNSESFQMRVYSLNEIDLICRFTGFQLKAVFSGESFEVPIHDHYGYIDNLTGFETMYVLEKD